MPNDLILKKLEQMGILLKELEGLLALPFPEFKGKFTNVRSAERDFQLIVELASDINAHTIAELGAETPDTYLTTIDYPSEYSIFLESTITNDTPIPDRIYGKYGTMELGGDPTLRANGDFASEFKEKNDGYTEVRLTEQKGRDMEGVTSST